MALQETPEHRANEEALAVWFAQKYGYIHMGTPQLWPYDRVFARPDRIFAAELKCREYGFDFFRKAGNEPAIQKTEVDAMLKLDLPVFLIQQCLDDGVIMLNLRDYEPDYEKMFGTNGDGTERLKMQCFYSFDKFKIIHNGPIELPQNQENDNPQTEQMRANHENNSNDNGSDAGYNISS